MASININGDSSGSVTLSAPAVAGSSTQNLVAASGTLAPLIASTAQATTSGTSIDFTSIPSWVKRVTVMFNGVSTNGTSIPLVQLGTGGTPTTTGYVSSSSEIFTAVDTVSSTVGFNVYWNSASYLFSGSYVFTNISGNVWVGSSVTASTVPAVVTTTSAGKVTLSGALNMVRITTTNGTDTFDAGSINILYE